MSEPPHQYAEIARLTRKRDEARSATERFLERAVAAERERCAEIAEAANYGDVGDEYERGWREACAKIAAAIRGGSDKRNMRDD